MLKKGGFDRYQGGWGSLGVAGDRSVGMFINTGGYNHYQGTDQSIGTARKPRALGVFIDTQGHNTYLFQNTSNANVQKPESPDEWLSALFLELGGDNRYPKNVDEMQRGDNLRWGIEPHSFGLEVDVQREGIVIELFETFPAYPRVPFPFNPIIGWSSNTAYFPLKKASNPKELQEEVQELLTADYERRRQLYESIDLLRFSYPNFEIDLSPLLMDPAHILEDLSILDWIEVLGWSGGSNPKRRLNFHPRLNPLEGVKKAFLGLGDFAFPGQRPGNAKSPRPKEQQPVLKA